MAAVTIVYSNRKTISLQVKADGTVLVRAPFHCPQARIDAFLAEQADWIAKQQQRFAALSQEPRLTEAELQALAVQACEVIPNRVAYFAARIGVTYGKITIRNQKTCWGSCSSLGNLNFNCLLMLCPPAVVDAVVVHELCHRLHPNHSKAFYDAVKAVLPDYAEHDAWLKANGSALMHRMIG